MSKEVETGHSEDGGVRIKSRACVSVVLLGLLSWTALVVGLLFLRRCGG